MHNLWSKASVTRKVFYCLSLVFILYVLLNFLGEILFYGGIYSYRQKQKMIKNLEEFTENYEGMNDFDDINSAIVKFSNENGSYVMIMSDEGDILHSLSYDMTVYDSYGVMYRFSLDRAVNDKGFADLDLNVGDMVSVMYSVMYDPKYKSFYNPQTIKKNSYTWSAGDNKKESKINAPIPYENYEEAIIPGVADRFIFRRNYEISGIITKIDVPTDFDVRDSIKRNESTSAIMDAMARSISADSDMEAGKNYIYIYDNGSERYMVLSKKITHIGSTQYIFTVNTLRSMDEAIDIMKSSYKLWLLAALVVVVFTSLILSGIITKPVRNMSAVTKKMKNLDFSQKCVVHSQDELGVLAQNINDMSDRLDRTICELTEANAKLKSDIEKEREMENQRSEFVAAVSHELKTPLAIIRAYSEGLIDGVSVEKQSRYINIIIDETKKMNALVNDMLQNSKLESGVMNMDITRHNLSEFLMEISLRLSQNAKEKNITIVNDIQKDIYADFDKYYLEQVAGNFITNAIRHTPEGMNIFVSASENENYCEVSVENEGSRIEEDDLDKVWNRFYKADKSRSGEGTGLGLSIAKNILTLHNARYCAENTDKGVRFMFRLAKGERDE